MCCCCCMIIQANKYKSIENWLGSRYICEEKIDACISLQRNTKTLNFGSTKSKMTLENTIFPKRTGNTKERKAEIIKKRTSMDVSTVGEDIRLEVWAPIWWVLKMGDPQNYRFQYQNCLILRTIWGYPFWGNHHIFLTPFLCKIWFLALAEGRKNMKKILWS